MSFSFVLHTFKMEKTYKLFKGQNLVTEQYSYLINLLGKPINQIIDEVCWVAFHIEGVLINEPAKGKLIIYGKNDAEALNVLLRYLEMQLLLSL